MKRYSNRNQLVTLSDRNVTPRLALALVLRSLCVIATPLREQGMKLDLPEGGEPETAMKPEDILTVEVSRDGSQLLLDRQPMNILQLAEAFKKAYAKNPKTVVYVRVDRDGMNKHTMAVLDTAQKSGLTQVSFRTKEGQR